MEGQINILNRKPCNRHIGTNQSPTEVNNHNYTEYTGAVWERGWKTQQKGVEFVSREMSAVHARHLVLLPWTFPVSFFWAHLTLYSSPTEIKSRSSSRIKHDTLNWKPFKVGQIRCSYLRRIFAFPIYNILNTNNQQSTFPESWHNEYEQTETNLAQLRNFFTCLVHANCCMAQMQEKKKSAYRLNKTQPGSYWLLSGFKH